MRVRARHVLLAIAVSALGAPVAYAGGTDDAKTPIRPPPFKDDVPYKKLPTLQRFDVGVDAILVSRPASDTTGGAPSKIAYHPTIGIGVHARVRIIRYLQAGVYYNGSEHGIEFSPGALGTRGPIQSHNLQAFSFGAKFMPTLPLGERVRLWGTAGIGWGRFEFPDMTVRESGIDPYVIKARGNSFVEFPLGIGASFTIIKHWLSIDTELIGAPQKTIDGTSFSTFQAIAGGSERAIPPLAHSHVTYVQSLGLSLLL